jgi:hypothetical protein
MDGRSSCRKQRTDGPAVVKSSLQVVMATREGCLPLLTLSGMLSGEARQIKVFEQHRRRHVRKCWPRLPAKGT